MSLWPRLHKIIWLGLELNKTKALESDWVTCLFPIVNPGKTWPWHQIRIFVLITETLFAVTAVVFFCTLLPRLLSLRSVWRRFLVTGHVVPKSMAEWHQWHRQRHKITVPVSEFQSQTKQNHTDNDGRLDNYSDWYSWTQSTFPARHLSHESCTWNLNHILNIKSHKTN